MNFQLEPFLQTLKDYNTDIWPLQIFAYLLGFVSILFSFKVIKNSSKIITATLIIFWLWNGLVFSFFYWGQSYKPAYLFGIILIIQGGLFFYSGIVRNSLTFKFKYDSITIQGLIFILYAMAGYPALGYFLNHTYPYSFPFGLVPCPLNIFTIGLLMWTSTSIPKYLLVIPFLWSLAGFVPISVGIYEDIGMMAAGILGTYLILKRDRKNKMKTAAFS